MSPGGQCFYKQNVSSESVHLHGRDIEEARKRERLLLFWISETRNERNSPLLGRRTHDGTHSRSQFLKRVNSSPPVSRGTLIYTSTAKHSEPLRSPAGYCRFFGEAQVALRSPATTR